VLNVVGVDHKPKLIYARCPQGEKSCTGETRVLYFGMGKKSGLRCWPEMRTTKQGRLLQISGDIIWATAIGSSILDDL
jgi:hypothetical protein